MAFALLRNKGGAGLGLRATAPGWNRVDFVIVFILLLRLFQLPRIMESNADFPFTVDTQFPLRNIKERES